MDKDLKRLKMINFFQNLEKREVLTQNTMAKKIVVSIGMANALIKRSIKKGFIKAKAAPYKRYAYYLTPDGFGEKSRLVKEYLESSLDFYSKAKKEFIKIFSKIKCSNFNTPDIVVVGKGDLVDILKLASMSSGVKINHYFDWNNEKKKIRNNNKNISEVKLKQFSAFIIVDTNQPQMCFDYLSGVVSSDKIFTPKFLHISKSKLSFDEPNVHPKGK